jgi:hypothetical protein
MHFAYCALRAWISMGLDCEMEDLFPNAVKLGARRRHRALSFTQSGIAQRRRTNCEPLTKIARGYKVSPGTSGRLH